MAAIVRIASGGTGGITELADLARTKYCLEVRNTSSSNVRPLSSGRHAYIYTYTECVNPEAPPSPHWEGLSKTKPKCTLVDLLLRVLD